MTSPWQVLGLERGADRDAIRRAYAQRLRVTQPEDDPAGFKALREAYEQALRVSSSAEAVSAGRRADETRFSPPRTAEAPTPVTPAPRRDFELIADRLLAILQSDDPSATAQGPEVLATLLAHPDVDNLSERVGIEMWLAQQLAWAGPAADPLLEQAIRFFGWKRGTRGGMPAALEQVLQRREALAVEATQLSALSRRSNGLNAGWKALTQANRPVWRRRLQAVNSDLRRQVLQLLERAETWPMLAGRLSPEAVVWWRRRLSKTHPEDAAPMSLLCLLQAIVTGVALKDMFGLALAWAPVLAGATALWLLYALVLRPHLIRPVPAPGSRPWLAWTVLAATLPFAAMLIPTASPVGLIGAVAISLAAMTWRAAQPATNAPVRLFGSTVLATGQRLITLAIGAGLPLLLMGGLALPCILVTASLAAMWLPSGAPLVAVLSPLSAKRRRLLLLGVTLAALVAPWLSFSGFSEATVYRASLGLCVAWALAPMLVRFEPESRRIRWGLLAGLLLAAYWFLVLIAGMGAGDRRQPAPYGRVPPPIAETPVFSKAAPEVPFTARSDIPPGCEADAQGYPALLPQLCRSPAWLDRAALPPEPGGSGHGGSTTLWVAIDKTGRASDCSVMESGGDAGRDRTACRMLARNGRFIPAHTRAGRPTLGTFTTTVDW